MPEIVHDGQPKSTTTLSAAADSSSAAAVQGAFTSPGLEPSSGRSWLPDLTGSYARIPAWWGRERWLVLIEEWFCSPWGALAREVAGSMLLDTFMRCAAVEAATADGRSGRGVATSHVTLARRARVSPRTAERFRRLLRVGGWSRTVFPGTYLTAQQQAEARRVHGGRQRRSAAVRALTLPSRIRKAPSSTRLRATEPVAGPVENGDLPLWDAVKRSPPVSEIHTTRARARSVPASREPSTPPTRQNPRTSHIRHRSPRPQPAPLAMQKFAAELCRRPDPGQRRLPLLARTTHIGAVVKMLTDVGIDPNRMTPQSLVVALDQVIQSKRITVPERIENPIAWYRWLLNQTFAQHIGVDSASTPGSANRDLARAAAREALAAERATEARRVAAIDRAAVAEVLAQLRADINADRTRRMRGTRGAPSGVDSTLWKVQK
ncbi:hypothetical protein SAMN06295924_1256 [Rathayibacter rathayi NCPPB 2980 = VKM Ac-1601]|nr:hypothetical protein FB469_3135 [Rathayibacter rathayi]SOE06043.1 hypothetical protein SAMN06295924_1256 [Rathayibacter rathayi NCPPB 2980 = VKM Ac-1601]